jgi:hypothetical protein
MDGDKLANVIAAADARFGGFAFVLQILRRQTNRNKRKDARVLTNNRSAIDNDVRLETNPILQLNLVADN